MSDQKKKLTKTIVDALEKPTKGDAWTWDLELPGFGVRVQASGRKTYVIRYRLPGSNDQRKMTLCRCGDMPPDRARDLARKKFAEVAEGGDPAGERRAKREGTEATVEAMFKGYVATMRAAGKVSADEVERALLTSKTSAAADSLGRTKPAREVTSAAIVQYVGTFYDAGHRGAADKARSYISSAFAWAIRSANDYTVPPEQRYDWGITVNPAAAVGKDAGASRAIDRALTISEWREVWLGTLDPECPYTMETAACVRVLLACGQRVRETLRLEGREINFEKRQWVMPKHKTKMKLDDHVIPLPEVIIPTLRELVAKHGDGWLFPSRSDADGEVIEDTSVNHALARWNKDAKLPRFTPRDLRRTWKSRAKDAGVDRFTRDLIQQHAKSDTGSVHYDRADYLPEKTAAMEKWSRFLGILLSGGTPAEPGQPRLQAVA